MLLEDITKLEHQYYGELCESNVPVLLCNYYEERKLSLTYYLSHQYLDEFTASEFYFMMVALEMGHLDVAYQIYNKYSDDWLNVCKQNNIYWKHVALFAIYFRSLDINDYYDQVFNMHYDNSIIQLLYLLIEINSIEPILQTPIFIEVKNLYPNIENILMGRLRKDLLYGNQPNACWDKWTDYNSHIGKGNYYGIELVYTDDSLRIFSYKPKAVAASMHIITDGITTIVLDCGCEIIDENSIRIPIDEVLDYLHIEKIDACFISHAHMDHYGSLNSLPCENIYMTSATKQLIQLSAPEIALTNIRILEEYSTTEVNQTLVSFIPNGHIRGSVMIALDWKGSKKILYTGDFSIEDQQTVNGLLLENIDTLFKENIDILITETTYGNRRNMLRLHDYENIFLELCQKQIEAGNKIIIPCFAIGRAQEVALLLSKLAAEKGLRVLIDGMASKITTYYQFLTDKRILSTNISAYDSELDISEKLANNDIILASSGMLKGTVGKYIREVMKQDNVCIIKVGYINEDEHMLASIKNRDLTICIFWIFLYLHMLDMKT